MKNIYTSKQGTFMVLFIFLCLNSATDCFAQGTWIEQSTNPTMSGVYRTKTGSDCIIHTKASSRYVYFFDIYAKAWTEADLGKQQNIKAVEAGKHVVFAYTDSLLIAYSSLTSTYTVLAYSGNILSQLGSISNTRGYGCGDKAAYVWTDQNIFYVFDGLAGEWKWYEYGETQNASGSYNFWCGDNYVAGVFQRKYPDIHRNIVYSLVTGSFNKTETGGYYYASSGAMTVGFVSIYNRAPEEWLFAGYSAYTNQFYIRNENTPYYVINLGSNYDDNTWRGFAKRNVFGYTISRGDGQTKDAYIHTFDTEKAAWFTHTTSFSLPFTGGFSNYRIGSNTAICSIDYISDPSTFFLYSGETGDYRVVQPGILFKLHGHLYNVGNMYAAVLDDWNHAWFYNTKTGFSQFLTFDEGNFTNVAYSADFISFCRYKPTLSTMELWFYNSKTDKSSRIEISKDVYPHYKISPYSYVFVPKTVDSLAVFYSAIHDTIMAVTTELAGNNSIYSTVGIFSWLYNITSPATSVLLYDAANLKLLNFDAYPVSNNISDSLILFKNGNIYHVYDASNQTTTTFDLGTTPGSHKNGGDIILVSNLNYSRFYAFQKGRTEWIELVPQGNSLFYSASKQTAVVARFSKVYAFAPGIITGIDNEIIKRPETISLDQNYPNPFYTSTVISFNIPKQSFVKLNIVNTLGTEVSTLVSEKLPAGIHTFKWDASGLPAGVYFYKLQANGCSETKKMVVGR